MIRPAFIAAFCLILAGASTPSALAFAGEPPFDQGAFEAAQKADKPILIHITASWCSVCAAQKPILDRLLADPRFKPIVLFNVDFDTRKDLVHKFGAWAQSTFVLFKGTREVALSSGDTRPKAIELLLGKAL